MKLELQKIKAELAPISIWGHKKLRVSNSKNIILNQYCIGEWTNEKMEIVIRRIEEVKGKV